MSAKECDLLVIGGGPAGFWAGLVGAIKGLKTILAEEGPLGGTCLNRGCVPLAVFLNYISALRLVKKLADEGYGVSLKDLTIDAVNMFKSIKSKVVDPLSGSMRGVLENLGVEVINGRALLESGNSARVGSEVIKFKRAVVATGLRWGGINGAMPPTEFTDIDEVPSTVVVIGGNAFGLGIASAFSLLGSEVILVEDGELLSGFDKEIVDYVTLALLERGVRIFTNAKVVNIINKGDIKETHLINPEGELRISSDEVIDASTYVPRNEVFGGVSVRLKGGYVAVDEYLRTSTPNIYAAGDITGNLPYAHVAIVQGIIAGLNASGGNLRINYKAVPKYLYAYPDAFSAGLTEAEAKELGYEVAVARQSLTSNALAKASGSEGIIKIVVDAKYGGILGIHGAGVGISELINEAAILLGLESTSDAVLATFLAHPTVGEVLREALIQVTKS